MRIGFDFDKVFIDYPPLIPYFLIDFLYKGTSVFKKKPSTINDLAYRFPGTYEQQLRIFSHHPSLRKLISENVSVLKKLSKNKRNKTYLVSSRFSFLKKRTDDILKKYMLTKYFNGIYFNYKNEQPHLFKEQTIQKLKIDVYIDDDVQLALYLAKKNPKLKIFWITGNKNSVHILPKSITPIKTLSELSKYLPVNE